MRPSFGLFYRSAVRRYERIGGIIVSLICFAFPVLSQTAACPSSSVIAATEADKAYSQKRYADAENLYVKALAQQPKDIGLTAGLVRILLQEGKISQASAQVDGIFPENARSAIALTALAEVQLRQGLPWLAMKSLDAAEAANPCYARSHLVRSRLLRIDSMYASERAEIQRAYEIDPTDPDIRGAWRDIVSPANEIKSIDQSRAAMNDLDAKARQTAEVSLHALMSRLSENSQSCQVLPAVASAKLPLLASVEDKLRHRYQLEVQLPGSSARLLVDTAASGLYISRALAEQNNLHQGAGAPEGTVHVDDVNIGPLEFRDCTVGVSDTPFPDKSDGIISTDIFASYLITLDFQSKKLTLEPLPPQPGLLPEDRSVPPELKDFVPVYHRRQYLLLPVTLNNKSRQLFILGTGMPNTAMTSEVAHSVSNLKTNFTNSGRTASGAKEEFYRDNFDLQLANLPQIQHRRILEFDLSAMDRNAGFQIAGVLGVDILHALVLHLDYRDGLIKFDLADKELMPVQRNGTSISVM